MRLIISILIVLFLSSLAFASVSYFDNQVEIDFDYIYKDVFLAQQGGLSWQPYMCSGNAYNEFWYQECQIDMSGKSGTYFVATYACDLVNNQFDCNNNQWRVQQVDIVNTPPNPDPTPQPEDWVNECNDGIDNDGDGLVDQDDDKGATEGKRGAALGCFGPNQQETTKDYGFTLFTPASDTKIYYVSNSGSDNNNGLSPQTPIKTLDRAKKLIRKGAPDWVLMKRGDEWNEGLTVKDGVSPTQRSLYGAYGYGERPTIPKINLPGFNEDSSDFLTVTGIRVKKATRGPDVPNPEEGNNHNGFNIDCSNYVLIEDSVFEANANGLTFDSNTCPSTNIVLRRSQVIDSYKKVDCGGTRQQISAGRDCISLGIYAQYSNDMIVEDNFFDMNGYLLRDPKFVSGEIRLFNQYNHDLYFHKINRAQIRNNVFLRAAGSALKMDTKETEVGMQNVVIENNYVGLAGDGIALGSNKKLPDMHNNNQIIDNVVDRVKRVHIDVAGSFSKNIKIVDNVITNPLIAEYSDTGYSDRASGFINVDGSDNLVMRDNAEYNIRNDGKALFDGRVVTFKDPSRNLEKYAQQVLGIEPSFDAFSAESRKQSRTYWREELTADALNDWIQEGFEVR